MMKNVIVTGSFDDLRSRQVRFLEEASKFGPLHVWLWTDELVQSLSGKTPKFPVQERRYFVQAIRYVEEVHVVDELPTPEALASMAGFTAGVWAEMEESHTPEKLASCLSHGIEYRLVKDPDLQDFSIHPSILAESQGSRKKVIVTGCYDWLHSGHVRFFEEVSELGDLYVAVGNDENVRFLKGPEHPFFPQDERAYMVQAIRYVAQALFTSGMGWMDAEPEIVLIKPDIYAVNEDGDKPEKRTFCQEHGLEYAVLKRAPKPGLPRRESTTLRGF